MQRTTGPAPAMTSLPRWPPRLLERFEPLDVLAATRPRLVYLAQDRERDRPVHVLLADADELPGWRAARFAANQRLTQSYRHPRLLLPTASGREGDRLYAVFPAPPGPSLRAVLRESPAPWEAARVVDLARAALEALEFLHRKGLVYRLFDADRLYRDGETWRLADSATLLALGEPAPPEDYPSPAARLGQRPRPGDDLYLLGLLLFELLSGVKPVVARRPARDALPDSPRKHRPFLPPALSDWVMRLLDPRPSRRPADAEAALAELEALRDTPELGAAPAFLRDEDPARDPAAPDAIPAAVLAEPELPPMAPGYRAAEAATWWQVALVVGGVQLAVLMGFSALAPADEPAAPAHKVPHPQRMAAALDQSADRVTEAGGVEAGEGAAGGNAAGGAAAGGSAAGEAAAGGSAAGEAAAARENPAAGTAGDTTTAGAAETGTEAGATARPGTPGAAPGPAATGPGPRTGTPGGDPTPGASPRAGAPGGAPRPASTPFADLAAEVAAARDAARSWGRGPAGEILRGEDAADAEPFLDSDPLYAGAILRGLAPAARFRAWAAGGGDPAALAPATRDALKALDDEFRAAGLPRPFSPYLGLKPRRTKTSPPEAWRRVLGREPPPGVPTGYFGGWFATAVREAEAATQALAALESRARAGATEQPWVRAVHAVRDRDGRLELAGLTEAGRRRWRAALVAAARGMRARPALTDTLALFTDAFLRRTRALAATEVLGATPSELAPGPDSPGLALVRARLGTIARRLARAEIPGFEAPAASELAAAWRAAGRRDSWSEPATRRGEIAALEELALLAEEEDEDEVDAFFRRVEPRLSEFAEDVQAAVYARLFDVMVATKSRLALAPAEFERVAKRARYLSPLLPKAEEARLVAGVARARGF